MLFFIRSFPLLRPSSLVSDTRVTLSGKWMGAVGSSFFVDAGGTFRNTENPTALDRGIFL